MIKDIIIPDINNWQSSWILNCAERRVSGNLTGLKGNVIFSIGHGLITGLIIAAIELLFSVSLHSRPGFINNLNIFGIVFFQGAIFSFLMTMALTLSHEIKKKLVENRQSSLLLSSLTSISTLVIIFVISYVYFIYFSPTKYIGESSTYVHVQNCIGEDCKEQLDGFANSANHATVDRVAKNVSEPQSGSSNSETFDNLTPNEFDEYLESTGFKDFNIKSTSKKVAESLGEIGLFPDKKNLDWEQFLLDLDEAANESSEYASIKIMSALRNEAPFDVVLKIINRGHQLTGSHLVILAKYFTVDEFQKLENYGIDISLQSSAGSNVLVRSLLNKDGPELFEYLATKDELVLGGDTDVLKEVLQLSSQLNRPVKYAKLLIDKGARITDETKSWVENDLRESNFNYYTVVKSRILL